MAAATLAQASPQFPQHVLEIYGSSDPMLDTKLKLEKMMGVYLTHPPRRHNSEKIQIKKSTVYVDVWQTPLGLSDDELKCRAVKWLIFGRTKYEEGGRAVLSRHSEFDTVKLTFNEILRPKNSRRKTQSKDRIRPYLHLTLKRHHLKVLELSEIREMIARQQCSRIFKRPLKGHIASKFTKARRKQN